MEFLFPLILTIHILVGLSVIGLVLLQHGKGADMGAAFGGGASGSLFGASGSANFLSRTTAVLATAFFITSLGLSYVAGSRPKPASSVMEAPVKPATEVPVAGKSTVPSGDKPAAESIPSPGAPVDKEKLPAPSGDKTVPGDEKAVAGAKKADVKPAAKSTADTPADKANAVTPHAGGSAEKAAAPVGKKTTDTTSSQAGTESKAKEIPK